MSMDAEPMHLDVVSTYTFDSKGLVVQHTVDRVDIDGTPTDALNLLKTDHGKYIRQTFPCCVVLYLFPHRCPQLSLDRTILP